jgi:hypothetical protein
VLVVPLLRRMIHVEKLTLYLRINTRLSSYHGTSGLFDDTNPYVDGTHLHDNVLVYIPQLHSCKFYISTESVDTGLIHRKSTDDIQQTFTHGIYGQTACIIDYYCVSRATCHVYSLPFQFTRLENISKQFPNVVLHNVTHLSAYDTAPMKHEFFMRISRAFPMLKRFTLVNNTLQTWKHYKRESDGNSLYSIIEYPHLISLDIIRVHEDYVYQFLLETRTYLPHLTELKVMYDQLKIVTMNFTSDTTRRNCSKVKRLFFEKSKRFSEDIYQYFPSL